MILAQLIPDYLPDKTIFSVANDPAYSGGDGTSTPANSLAPGENHWGYVINLTEKSNPRLPLIADGTVPGGTAYSRIKGTAGGHWKGLKAVVNRVDISGAVEKRDPKTLAISEPNSGITDILQSGQKRWLDKTQVFLNPIPKSR